MHSALLLVLITVLITPIQAKSVDKPIIDLTIDSCLQTNQSTAGMLECFTRAEQAWDEELNRVYKALQGRLKPNAQAALKQAQRTRMQQRDQEFALINAIHEQLDGTLWIPVMASKRADVVKQRALALQSYLSLLEEGSSL